MNNSGRILLAIAFTTVFPLLAYAQQPPPASEKFIFNGHTYEVVVADGIDWDSADSDASSRSHAGFQGHLATITSFEEDQFINQLRETTQGINLSGCASNPQPACTLDSQLWVGGFQVYGSPEPGDGWIWVNAEGNIPTPTSSGPGYSNWLPAEPNNAGGNEQHLATGWGAMFGWNDGGGPGNDAIWGYVVEYDGIATQDANDCKGNGCNPTGVQRTTLPDSVILLPTDTYDQEITDIIRDPRVNDDGECVIRQSFDVYGDGTLILPDFLCGSPQIAVVLAEATFEMLEDVIFVEQFPERLFARTFACEGAPGDNDLQRRGVVGWQPTDISEIREGRVLNVKNGCGTSEGSVRDPSFFILNLHIDCGIPFDTDPNGVLECFTALTSDDIDSLGVALSAAKKALQNYSYGQLRSSYVHIRNFFRNGEYEEAVAELGVFINRVRNTSFDPTSGFNFQGDLLMRALHIEAITADEIIPATN